MNESGEQATYVELVANLLRDAGRGATVSHVEISQTIGGLAPPNPIYFAVVHRAMRRLLREDGLAVLCEPSLGYHVCTEREQVTTYVQVRSKRAGRQLNRAVKAMDAIADDKLSLHVRRVKEARLAKLRTARRECKVDEKRLNILLHVNRPVRPNAQPA